MLSLNELLKLAIIVFLLGRREHKLSLKHKVLNYFSMYGSILS
jgi:hypothetical protein